MLLRIKVKPNSKTDSIYSDASGNIRVKIRAQPVDGKANKYLTAYLSEIFRLPASKIEIIKGHNTPFKTIKLDAEDAYINSILKSFKKNRILNKKPLLTR